MLEVLNDYDWKEAFGYAGEPDACGSPDIRPVPMTTASPDPMTREDVEHIQAMSVGENDGPPWMIYGRLKDGRWFYLEAGCDYTGWDCQAGGSVSVASSQEEIETFGLTDEARERFGMEKK